MYNDTTVIWYIADSDDLTFVCRDVFEVLFV